jgi:epoxyqueuosine reductase
LGFDVCRFTTVAAPLRREYFRKWIAEGQHGNMEWLGRNVERRLDPRQVLPEARSIVTLGLNYYQPQPPRRGRIATYALGKDYHNLIYKRLKKLCTWMREHGGAQKPYVDTGPVLERAFAAHSGLGWQAKSTMVIHRKFGNWLFLGVVLTTLEIEPDEPESDHCGKCTRCIEACPTGAITAPYQLDARKCISYLTIEHHGSIPMEYRRAIGDRVFGCDECLAVCPWNRWAQTTREMHFTPTDLPDLRETLAWDEETFAEYFRGTPIKRLKLHRWKRNACVVLGNIGTPQDLPALQTLADGEDPVIAEHAQWAINEIVLRRA